ncbi:hypothetical protein HYRO_8 [Mycobacterium phage HyRo]|uniref:Uncharacterized protein n=1 Tax=Mycobacterium phage HyRo TaxID=1698710 RepID=A0A0K2FLV6_9CAUD|nr:hypothetical protein HYRO_8 [Mycobacterium phage HyRo]ALA48202.1 hypothetical protein HYRO_8 [Mycobacterium phage HyRo]
MSGLTNTITLHQVSDDEEVRPATVDIRHIRSTTWNKDLKLTVVGLEAALHSSAPIRVLEHPRRISLLIRRVHQAQVVRQAQAPRRDNADTASYEAYAQDVVNERAGRFARAVAAEEQWKTDVSQQIRGIIERLETLQAARQVDASNNRGTMTNMSNLLAEARKTNGLLAEIAEVKKTNELLTRVLKRLVEED